MHLIVRKNSTVKLEILEKSKNSVKTYADKPKGDIKEATNKKAAI